jgi:hypothetical protein
MRAAAQGCTRSGTSAVLRARLFWIFSLLFEVLGIARVNRNALADAPHGSYNYFRSDSFHRLNSGVAADAGYRAASAAWPKVPMF